MDDDLDGTRDATEPVPRWALDDDLSTEVAAVRPRWEVPELVAAGASLASVGLFVGFVTAGVDVAVQVQQVQLTTVAISLATSWIAYTVPLTFLAVLAAWWGGRQRGTDDPAAIELARRRLRPSVMVVAILALPTAAAGVTRFIDTLVNLQTGGALTKAADVGQSAAICALALAGGGAQWLAARRLLASAPDEDTPVVSPSSP